MANYPSQLKERDELNLRLGIKSSLSQLRSVVASLYVIYVASDKQAQVIYSKEGTNGSLTSIKLEDNLARQIDAKFPATAEKISSLVSKTPLFTAQIEALQVGIELFFHLAKISFVATGLSERTGSSRFQKGLSFATNMILVDLYLSSHSSEDINKLLAAWLEDKPFISKLEDGLKMLLNTFTEETQYKIRDNNYDEIVFNQEGVYATILNDGEAISKDANEPVGPFRIYKSYVASGMHPYLIEQKQEFKLNGSVSRADLENYAQLVSTALDITPRKTTIEREIEPSKTIENESPTKKSAQIIYYGAPGTGKSREIKEKTKDDDTVIRTTFHPDSDYSTFVGCYKPTMEATNLLSLQKLHELYPEFKKTVANRPLQRFIAKYYNSFRVLTEKEAESVFNKIETPVTVTAEVPKVMAAIEELPKDSSIAYSFVAQAFTKAYVQAWKKLCNATFSTTPIITNPAGKSMSPYSTTSKIGSSPDFDYTPDGATLTDPEKDLLNKVDNFGFPFEGIDNFADLHNKIKAVVVTGVPNENQKERYHKEISLTAEHIRDLYAKWKGNLNIYGYLESLLAKIARKTGLGFHELETYNGENVFIEVDESDDLLGLYDSNSKTVYLFKNNIKNDKELCAVYIHEMFHAYFDSLDQYVPEIEEPIVECCALCFLELFNDDICKDYLNHVEQKQQSSAICYYGFGAYLYDNRSLDWMKLYQNGFDKINESSAIVNDYKNKFFPIYPFEEEQETMGLLYNILNPQSKTEFDKSAQFLIIEEINRGNCAQIFGDLFQLLDRGDHGYSEYPIVADDDLRKVLSEEFKDINLVAVKHEIDSIFSDNYRNGISDKIKSGEILVLPKNLYIWATMNTSDQSLFPIDSAFKRRWEWKYIKITEGKNKETQKPLKWKILVEDEEPDKVRLYDWWDFLQEINKIIYSSTESADKQMGYFFTKAAEHLRGEIVEVIGKNGRSVQNPVMNIDAEYITAETFVNKVLFYLWTDVMKDNEYEEITNLVRKDGNPKLMFPDFFDETGEYANHENIRFFLDNVMKDKDKWCDVCEVSLEAPKDSSRWFRSNSIIFKITDNPQNPEDLYKRAKEAWYFDKKRANLDRTKYVYVYVAPLKEIVECYEVSEWYETKDEKEKTRFGFKGEPVEDDMKGMPVERIAHARGGVVFYPENI